MWLKNHTHSEKTKPRNHKKLCIRKIHSKFTIIYQAPTMWQTTVLGTEDRVAL